MTDVAPAEPAPVTAAPAPTLVGIARRMGWRGVREAVIPLVLFVALNTAAGLAWAVAAVTAWTLALSVWRVAHRQRTGVVVWVVMGYVLIRGLAGIITESKVVYFGPVVAQTGLIALVFFVSVAIKRPAVGYIAPVIYPFEDYVRRHPAYRRAFSHLTLLWAVYLALRVVLDVWLLKSVDATMFVIIRAAIGFPIVIGLFVFSLRYPRAVFRREPDLLPYVEASETPAAAPAAA